MKDDVVPSAISFSPDILKYKPEFSVNLLEPKLQIHPHTGKQLGITVDTMLMDETMLGKREEFDN